MNLQIQANPEVLWRAVDGEIVVLDPKHGYYYGIDGVGARIWELLQKRTTPQRILKSLIQEYEVDEKRLREDMSKFISQLEKSGLLKYETCEP